MAPKQVKKQTTDNTESTNSISIQSIQTEWVDNVKKIITMREELSTLEKHNDELVSKLYEIMNKSPTNSVVVIEGDEKPTPKVVKKKEEDDVPVPAPKVTKKKADADKPAPASHVVKKDDDDEDEEKPAPIKPAAKVVKKKETETDDKPKVTKKKVVEKPEIEKPEDKPDTKAKKAAPKAAPKESPKEVEKPVVKGKITAPTKGTPKQKVVSKEIDNNPAIEDTSSEDTDIDSLSSVSSESDASGGEDN